MKEPFLKFKQIYIVQNDQYVNENTRIPREILHYGLH